MAQNNQKPRYTPVTKFASAWDPKAGEVLPFSEIRAQFKAAALSPDPKAAEKQLREEFNLVCPHCKQAELVFSKGSEDITTGIRAKIAGSRFPGNPAHLKTKAKSQHSARCIGTVYEHEGHSVDESLGFRLYLNFKDLAERNPRNGRLVIRNDKGRIIIRDPDLIGREAVSLSSPDKILPVLRSGQFDRIRKSLAVYGDKKIPWSDFFIHRQSEQDADARLKHLASQFLSRPESWHHPVMIDFQFDNRVAYTVSHGRSGNTLVYKFPAIHNFEHPVTQARVTLQPRLFVTNHHLFEKLKDIHRTHGEIFVMAESPKVYKSADHDGLYILGIHLDDPDMMCEANIKEIRQIAREREEKRKALIAESDTPAPKAA